MKSLPLLLLVCASCTGHVVFFDTDHRVYDELEPNDSAYSAPYFGGLRPGEGFSIAGHVTDDGPDLYDGFAVRADSPCTITFELVSHGFSTDLDVCVFDPELGQYVVCEDGLFDPEKGQITILESGKLVHFVVTSAAGSASYTLRLEASSAFLALASDDPAPAPIDRDKAEHRAGYHARELPEEAPLAPVPLPAELLEIDLETGSFVRRPVLIQRPPSAMN